MQIVQRAAREKEKAVGGETSDFAIDTLEKLQAPGEIFVEQIIGRL